MLDLGNPPQVLVYMLPGARCCLATPSNSHFNGFLRLVISPEDLFRVQKRSDTRLFQLTHFSASPSCLGGFTSAVSVWMFGKSSLRWRLATMRFRFTKLPDAFKLCHHLFVSNTVFQKMSSLTVLGFFFFSVQLWIANRSRHLDESATPESISTIMFCHATGHLSSPLANDKSISLPSVYEHITLNRQDHSFTWSSWKSPSPSRGCCSNTVGPMVQKHVEVGDFVDVSSAAKGHFLPIGPRESAVFTYVITSVYRTLMAAILPLK